MNKTIFNKILFKYPLFKEKSLFGRYITLQDIKPIIKNLDTNFSVKIIGKSFLDKNIYSIKIGSGKTKILVWSQMHGNESTGTKALFDVLSYFNYAKDQQNMQDLLSSITFLFLPMLNPDGAEMYSRFNAQEIDLNRDATNFKAPESRILHNILHSFNPDYCFNLHDQRTLFSIGKENLPATLSFLAPSENESRSVTPTRIKTMQVIVGIYEVLQKFIPNQIGRYTDEFYPTATGDNFQKAGFPTILIESGHFYNDYQREQTRKYNFMALISGFMAISSKSQKANYESYFSIPNNKKDFFDFIYTNIEINGEKKIVGIRYKEVLKNKKVCFLKEFIILPSISGLGTNSFNNKQLSFSSINEFKKFITNKK